MKSCFLRSNQVVVEAARIFDPRNLPADDTLSEYGEAEIDLLAYHYSEFIDRNQCQLEWEMLKCCMSSNFRTMKLQEFSLKLAIGISWQQIATSSDSCPPVKNTDHSETVYTTSDVHKRLFDTSNDESQFLTDDSSNSDSYSEVMLRQNN